MMDIRSFLSGYREHEKFDELIAWCHEITSAVFRLNASALVQKGQVTQMIFPDSFSDSCAQVREILSAMEFPVDVSDNSALYEEFIYPLALYYTK